ncbi:metal ABC transporter substrate-binding protein [Actinosynnema sp. NPDC059797]
MRRRRRPFTAALCLLALLVGGAACTEPQDHKLDVVVNVYALRWLAEQIGGDLVKVTMIEAGAHEGKLSQADRDLIHGADANLFALDLSEDLRTALDGWRANNPGRNQGDPAVYDISALDALALGPGPADFQEHLLPNGLDPHFWTDPRDRMQVAGEWVKNHLVSAVGLDEVLKQEDAEDHPGKLRAKWDEVSRRLKDLDGELKAGLGRCAGRVIVPQHPAFGYFVQTYGMRQLPVTKLLKGELPADELRRRQEELDALFASNAKPAFFYAFDAVRIDISRDQLTDLATKYRATPRNIDSLEREPAKRKADGSPMDYVEGMRWNADNIAKELGCA